AARARPAAKYSRRGCAARVGGETYQQGAPGRLQSSIDGARRDPLHARRAAKFIDVTWPLAIVRRRGKILLRRRAAGDLLGRLWELPGAPLTARIKPAGALRRELNSLSEQLGAPRRIGAFRHAITRRRIRAPVYLLECDARAPVSLPRGEWRWLRPDRFEHLPMSSMTKKALALLAAHETRSA